MNTGERLGPNRTGELRVKSPFRMKGYLNLPKASRDFFDAEGFAKLADAVSYDEEGRIVYIDRLKEIIK